VTPASPQAPKAIDIANLRPSKNSVFPRSSRPTGKSSAGYRIRNSTLRSAPAAQPNRAIITTGVPWPVGGPPVGRPRATLGPTAGAEPPARGPLFRQMALREGVVLRPVADADGAVDGPLASY
jgi:hypothetical protein